MQLVLRFNICEKEYLDFVCAAWNTCMICWIRNFSWSVTRWSLTYWLWHQQTTKNHARFVVQRREFYFFGGLSVLWISSQISCSSFVFINQSINQSYPGAFSINDAQSFLDDDIHMILGLLHTHKRCWNQWSECTSNRTIRPIEVHIINQLLIHHTKRHNNSLTR